MALGGEEREGDRFQVELGMARTSDKSIIEQSVHPHIIPPDSREVPAQRAHNPDFEERQGWGEQERSTGRKGQSEGREKSTATGRSGCKLQQVFVTNTLLASTEHHKPTRGAY